MNCMMYCPLPPGFSDGWDNTEYCVVEGERVMVGDIVDVPVFFTMISKFTAWLELTSTIDNGESIAAVNWFVGWE